MDGWTIQASRCKRSNTLLCIKTELLDFRKIVDRGALVWFLQTQTPGFFGQNQGLSVVASASCVEQRMEFY